MRCYDGQSSQQSGSFGKSEYPVTCGLRLQQALTFSYSFLCRHGRRKLAPDKRPSNKAYIALQEDARQAKRELWSLTTPPWEWRETHATSSHASKAAPELSCGTKRHCSQMRTCEEARFYFSHCGFKTLDQDGDGVPCESLCAPKK